mgnify:CR=1 FL=1
MKLEDLRVYNLSMELGEQVWEIVSSWNYFEKDTIGKQMVRAADSIAANFSEGFGRCHFKESKNFSYYSRGSLYETKTWLTKAFNRKLITEEQFKLFSNNIDNVGVKLNNYINSIGKTNTKNDN